MRQARAGSVKELTLRPYVPTPTGRLFHASPSFFRGIRGCIGSGKSVACCMEVFSRALEQEPDERGVRRTRWAFVRNCFSADTQVLTETRGWQYFPALLPADKVATMGDAGEQVWAKPTHYYSAPYKGDLITHHGEGVDFAATPDHRLLVSAQRTRKKVWGPLEFVTAEAAYGTHYKYRVPRTAKPTQVGNTRGLSEAWFEFLGFWFAEGCAFRVKSTGALRVVLTACTGQEYVRDLLGRCGIKWWLNGGRNFMLHVRTLPAWLVEEMLLYGKATTKAVPQWVKEAPAGHLEAFLHGHEVGDGAHAATGTFVVSTSSARLADDLQELAYRAGRTANIRLKGPEVGSVSKYGFRTTAQGYTVTYPKETKFSPMLSRKGWGRIPYDGIVYCVEVPGHRLLVRRNGVCHFNSQTYSELLTTTMKTWSEWIPPEICPVSMSAPIQGRIQLPLSDGTSVDCEVLFIALDRDDDVKKLKSLELTGLWLNEAGEIGKAVLDAGSGRVGRFPSKPTWSGVIADTNPPADDHWWYNLAEVEKPEGYSFWAQPPAMVPAVKKKEEDPTVWVPNDGSRGLAPAENITGLPLGWKYYERLVGGKSLPWIKVFIMGEYGTISSGRPVFPEFNESIHLSKEPLTPLRGLPILVGWDFGLNASCVFCQLTPKGQVLVLDELTSESMGIQRFVREMVRPKILTRFRDIPIVGVGDPAGQSRDQTTEQTCYQILAEEGLYAEAAPTNEFVARREAVVSFLTRVDGFKLDPRCTVLWKGFSGRYQYRKMRITGIDRWMEKPDKNEYSHVHDCIQYACLYFKAFGLPGGKGMSQQGRRREVKKTDLTAWS